LDGIDQAEHVQNTAGVTPLTSLGWAAGVTPLTSLGWAAGVTPLTSLGWAGLWNRAAGESCRKDCRGGAFDIHGRAEWWLRTA